LQWDRGENQDRDNGWPTRVNVHEPGVGRDKGEKRMMRVPSRQRRIDKFPLTAPRGIPNSQ